MILGTVTDDGVPTIILSVGGKDWPAVVDTGFNGDLELPLELKDSVNARFVCRIRSLLAGGQTIEEDNFLVDFPFDSRLAKVEATFSSSREILVGTGMLKAYHLEIDFQKQELKLQQAAR